MHSKTWYFIFCFMLAALAAQAQPGALRKIWDKTYGGDKVDYARTAVRTADGGFLLGGDSGSGIAGEKSQSGRGKEDYWVVRTNANGDKLWDKSFGTDSTDELKTVLLTTDGGFLLAGTSEATTANGDMSQTPQGGLGDFWAIKIDANGNKLWDKRFGSPMGDILNAAANAGDGFLLFGWARGSAGGDKTQNTKGALDYWAIRIDKDGNKLWDKSIGSAGFDYGEAITAVPDGGFLLAGVSLGTASGDKTQPAQNNSWDYWLVKIDKDGNKIWDKTYGGFGLEIMYSVITTADGGFLVSGATLSGADGDKTEDSRGGADAWLIRIDKDGNKVWDKRFGGGVHDGHRFSHVVQRPQGGFIWVGDSYTGLGGDKTMDKKGDYDIWVIAIGEDGKKLYDYDLGAKALDDAAHISMNPNGTFNILGTSSSSIGNDKSENSRGGFDFWLIKAGGGLLSAKFGHRQYFDRVAFSDSTKIDAFTSVTDYLWDFGDGTKSTLPNPVHTYAKAGDYTVKYGVKNNLGEFSYYSAIVRFAGLFGCFPNELSPGPASLSAYGLNLDKTVSLKFIGPDKTETISTAPIFFGEGPEDILTAKADFTGKKEGPYRMEARFSDGGFLSLDSALWIRGKRKADAYVRIDSKNTFVGKNKAASIKVAYGNRGNMEASGVAVWVAAFGSGTFDLKLNGKLILPAGVDTTALARRSGYDSLFLRKTGFQVFPLYFSQLPPNYEGKLNFTLKTDQPVTVWAWAGKPIASDTAAFSLCALEHLAGSLPDSLKTFDKAVFALKLKDLFRNQQREFAQNKASHLGWAIAKALKDAGVSFASPKGPQTVAIMLRWLAESSLRYQDGNPCKTLFAMKPLEAAHFELDKTPKYNALLCDDAQFAKGQRSFAYRMELANDRFPKAIQKMDVHIPLDSGLIDASGFHLQNIGFMGIDIALPPGIQEYMTDFELTNPKMTVRATLSFHKAAGGKDPGHGGKINKHDAINEARLSFRALDSLGAEIPVGSSKGFFPVHTGGRINKHDPINEKASFGFRTSLKAFHPGESGGRTNKHDAINQKAVIVYNDADKIETAFLSKLDTIPPTAAVLMPLAGQSCDRFNLAWSGQDNGGQQPRFYDVLAKTGSGLFKYAAFKIEGKALPFRVRLDTAYQFYALAYDSAGNAEIQGALNEASGLLEIPKPILKTIVNVASKDLEITGTKAGDGIFWFKDGVLVQTGGTKLLAAAIGAGKYKAKVTRNSCEAFSNEQDVSNPTGIDDLPENLFVLYPNPASGSVSLNASSGFSGKITIELCDRMGRPVLRAERLAVSGEPLSLLLPGVAEGLYFLKITTEKGVCVKKLLVE